MGAFAEILRGVASRIPEARSLMVIGTDGIPVEKLVFGEGNEGEAVAAELTTLLRAGLATTDETGLGSLQELSISSERMTAVLTAITPEYFLFAALSPGALLGRARFALRLACDPLAGELG